MNKDELFLEPKTTQYGSHMIMSNVNKPTKSKYINIDTRFCEEYNPLQVAKYNIMLPERITNVKNITVLSTEIPMSFYNISTNLNNNSFSITNNTSKAVSKVIVPDGQYNNLLNSGATPTLTLLQNAINSQLPSNLSITLGFNRHTTISLSSAPAYTVNFATDLSGNNDKYNFKFKLGWLLGFRSPTYTISPGQTITAEQLPDFTGSRYLYLAVDEYKGIQNSFITPMSSYLINHNILARISMDSVFPYGSVLPANRMNGLLTSDLRSYNGKVDLQRLNITLLNELGIPVALNGSDFSFCLKVDYE
jgi:hypothetical protein